MDKIKYKFLLNLKRRDDKLNFMKFKLKDIGIKDYNIIYGIDAVSSAQTDHLYENYCKNTINEKKIISKKSVFAIILSYKLIYEKVLHLNDEENILIFEDDIIFHKDFNKFDIPLDYDVLYLGANQLKWKDNYKGNYKFDSNEENITYGIYGTILKVKFVRKFYYSNLIDLLSIRKPLDYLIWEYVVNNNISNLVLYPNLIIPNLLNSDNMGYRDMIKISKAKKWNLNNYKYINLEMKYYYLCKLSKKTDIRKIKGHIDWLYFDTIYDIINGNY